MIGYLDIHEPVAVLRLQASELEDLPCTNCSRLLSFLRKLLDTGPESFTHPSIWLVDAERPVDAEPVTSISPDDFHLS